MSISKYGASIQKADVGSEEESCAAQTKYTDKQVRAIVGDIRDRVELDSSPASLAHLNFKRHHLD